MNRKVDSGPCKFNLDADVEMEASALGILEALFANEGTIVTHTGEYSLSKKHNIFGRPIFSVVILNILLTYFFKFQIISMQQRRLLKTKKTLSSRGVLVQETMIPDSFA